LTDKLVRLRVGDQHVVGTLGPQVHRAAIRRTERVVRPAAGGDLLDDRGLLRVDDPPGGVVAGHVGDPAVGRDGELVGPRADLHAAGYRVGGRVEPEQLALVAGGVLDGDEEAVAFGGDGQPVRLRADDNALDDLVGGGVDDDQIVAGGACDVELL